MTKRLLGMMTIAVTTLVVGGSSANASPITWSLQNVGFFDGGTASGSFAYDATLNVYTAINIATSATGGIPATVFKYKSIFGTASTAAVFVDSNAADLTGSHDLTLRFSNALTNAGGTSPLVLLFGSFETTCSNAQCGSVSIPTSYINGGSVATSGASAPEPATLSLIPLGLFAILAAKRRFLA